MRISISGPPGSGKTTICMLVANRLEYDFVVVGQIFRQMALERKVELEEALKRLRAAVKRLEATA